ncbi:MAG TPA: hypothetical protein VLW55_15690, partial [Burkholderiaceae bacterium]|nr:hypothetical protein [Burkholderiaceae bacterium]
MLCYRRGSGGSRRAQAKIRRYYEVWRARTEIHDKNFQPGQCDIETCPLHVANPTWKGKPLRMVLDHEDGN